MGGITVMLGGGGGCHMIELGSSDSIWWPGPDSAAAL